MYVRGFHRNLLQIITYESLQMTLEFMLALVDKALKGLAMLKVVMNLM